MRMKKGAALPGAIMLCFMLIIVSYAVGASILQMVANNKVQQFHTEQKEIFDQSYKEFLLNFDKSDITDEVYTWKSKEETIEAIDYVALAAYRSDDVVFYAIYDKTNEKTVAYQTSNPYIDSNGKLAGLIAIGE